MTKFSKSGVTIFFEVGKHSGMYVGGCILCIFYFLVVHNSSPLFLGSTPVGEFCAPKNNSPHLHCCIFLPATWNHHPDRMILLLHNFVVVCAEQKVNFSLVLHCCFETQCWAVNILFFGWINIYQITRWSGRVSWKKRWLTIISTTTG